MTIIPQLAHRLAQIEWQIRDAHEQRITIAYNKCIADGVDDPVEALQTSESLATIRDFVTKIMAEREDVIAAIEGAHLAEGEARVNRELQGSSDGR